MTSILIWIRARQPSIGYISGMMQADDPEPSLDNMPPDPLWLTERYVVEEQLASGGQGVVFRGRDRQTGQTVIVKQLHSEHSADPTSVARFTREAEALRQLNHPNIVRMLATFEHQSRHAIVMEYVPGGTLRQLMEREGVLPLSTILDVALELADALVRAHHLDILHRDIKPENVLLSESGAPRLTDFGVALLEADDVRLTQTGATPGSPAYMSPEALRGQRLDKRSDIWSFGVLLFEMIAGRRPFVGEATTAVMIKILQEPAPDLLALRSQCPAQLAQLVDAMLVKARERRPGSMRLVASVLEAIRAGEAPPGVSKPQHSMPEKDDEPGDMPSTGMPVPAGATSVQTPSPITENVPPLTIPFIGREQELGDLATLLNNADVRLITILGPGGIGKTQLAVQAGRSARETFADGTYFVPLAPLSSASEIEFAIAESIDLHLIQPAAVRQQLLSHLQPKEMLLILDNFEHVLDGAALVASIIETAPRITLLVTSRASLNLSFEHLFPLHGLPFPADNASEQELTAYAAVQLLLQQARQVRADLRPDEVNLRHAARVARLVQGMPLAVVLAARWAEMLSLDDIAEEIARSLDFLDTTMRDIPARQRSVRAVFESSWSQLSTASRDAFARLTVFRGGFTRHAAQEVAGADLRTLLRLVRKSFLSAARRDRYQIHELLRQYGEEQLEASGRARQVCDAHSAYYLHFLGIREQDIKGKRQAEALREIEADMQNIRRAWNWALRHGQRSSIDQGLETLHLFCDIRGRYQEGKELFASARQALAPASGKAGDQLWGRIVTRHGFLQVLVPADAQKVFSELELGMEIAKRHANHYEIAVATQALATFSTVMSRDDLHGEDLSRQASQMFEELGDPFFQARALVNLGISAAAGSDMAVFGDTIYKAVQIARNAGDIVDVSLCLANLTEYAIGMGLYDSARAYGEEAIELASDLDAPAIKAFGQACLSCVDLLHGNLDEATKTLNASLSLAEEIHSLTATAYATGLVALAAALRADYDNARRLALKARANPGNNTLGLVLAPWALCLAAIGEGDMALARRSLHEALQRAHALTFPAPPIWLLPVAAFMLTEYEEYERAVELLSLVDTQPMNPEGWIAEWTPLRERAAYLTQILDRERYGSAWARGRELDVPDVLQELIAAFALPATETPQL